MSSQIPLSPEASVVEVEALLPGGAALGHLGDGRAALLSGAVPGDRVRLTKVRDRHDYVRVDRWELIERAPDRITPRCPYGERCGGCDWMAIKRSRQPAFKLELVREALKRSSRLPDSIAIRWVEGHPNERYRQRIRLQLEGDGRLGFFSRASRELVVIDDCWVADGSLAEAIALLRTALAAHPGVAGLFAAVELRAPGISGELPSACFFPRTLADGAKRSRHRRPHQRIAPTEGSSADSKHDWWACQKLLGKQLLIAVSGEPTPPIQYYPLPLDIRLKAPVGSFTQVNWDVNIRLVDDVIRGALTRGLASFADFYAGCGNFTLPLLKAGLIGSAVESVAQSARALHEAALDARLTLRDIVAGDVAQTAARWTREHRSFELVIADPPRAGLGRELEQLADLCHRFLVVCSCDPVTFARDAGALTQSGFELEELTAYDMFPDTHHVELASWWKAPTKRRAAER